MNTHDPDNFRSRFRRFETQAPVRSERIPLSVRTLSSNGGYGAIDWR